MFMPRCPRCKSSRIQRGYNDESLPQRLLCLRELLCNNCNLEFRSFALPGSVTRNATSREDRSGNRRRAPRFRTNLPAYLSLMEVDRASSGVRFSPEIEGRTKDLSEVGVSFIIKNMGELEQRLDGSNRRLRVRIMLPTGPIHLHIAPVYRGLLDEMRPQAGRIIAGPITKIDAADRARLQAYLGTLQ